VSASVAEGCGQSAEVIAGAGDRGCTECYPDIGAWDLLDDLPRHSDPFLRLETHLNESGGASVRWCREANGDSERFHGLRGRWAFVVARRRRADCRRARMPPTSQALAMRSIGAVAMWTITLQIPSRLRWHRRRKWWSVGKQGFALG